MKKFVFRLETLLRYRINIEERERNAFTRIRAELLTELNHKDSLRAQQMQTRSELALLESGTCDTREIGWFYRFLDRLDVEMKRSDERIVELEKHLEAQKQKMIKASRDKQMIENLKNKKQKEYVVAIEREEQKTIDEIVVTRFALKP
jgi:flagellar FliJ protein